MRPAVDAQLHERALIDEQGESLARGELVSGVLGGDLRLAPAEHDLLAPRPQVLGERAQQACGGDVGGHERTIGSGAGLSRK